ncbi:MAG: class I SAM-dependent methyltransferase [Minisyncoccia bacterium]
MRTQDWKKINFRYPSKIPTMISREERKYLYWVGKSFWSGKGVIVEIGPWLGGSTVCLAMGMKSSGHPTYKRLKVFDNFIWRDFMKVRAKLPLNPGESFENYFLENLADYREIIDHRKEALPDDVIPNNREAANMRFFETDHVRIIEKFSDDPIEILFIDGAKSFKSMLHLLKTFNNNFVPGKTCFICQDYKYYGTYWVPILMIKLEKYLEPVHNVIRGSTVTFRLISAIPSGLLNNIESNIDLMNTDEMLNEIKCASNKLIEDGDSLGGKNILLGGVKFLSHQNKIDSAVKEFLKIQSSWGLFDDTILLERAREYLNAEKSLKIFTPKRLKLTKFINKIRKTLKSKIKKVF